MNSAVEFAGRTAISSQLFAPEKASMPKSSAVLNTPLLTDTARFVTAVLTAAPPAASLKSANRKSCAPSVAVPFSSRRP